MSEVGENWIFVPYLNADSIREKAVKLISIANGEFKAQRKESVFDIVNDGKWIAVEDFIAHFRDHTVSEPAVLR